MPSEWIVPLHGPTDTTIPFEAPHAVVSKWLDLDHRSPVKPYSLLPPISRGQATILTVRLLDDTLAEKLSASATPGTPVRLGRHHFTVPGPARVRHLTPWTELAASAPKRAWQIVYTTPATFRRRTRTSPWPAPDSILTSLASRWAKLRPDCAPELSRTTVATVWVSDVDGHSEPFPLKDTVVSGFLGRIRYVCDGNEADARTASALFSFARYAGIGSHTAYGLGAVQVEDTWQPRGRTSSTEQRQEADSK